MTGVSSLCNVIDYDLTSYKNLLERLGEASLEVEAALDDFPAGSNQHRNDRYNATRRTRDVESEDEMLVVIEGLLTRYQEHRGRLDDVCRTARRESTTQ